MFNIINNNINLDFNFLKDLFKFLFKRKKIDIDVLRQKAIAKIKSSTLFRDDYEEAVFINPVFFLDLTQKKDLLEFLAYYLFDAKELEAILVLKNNDILGLFLQHRLYIFIVNVLIPQINSGVYDKKLKKLDKKGKLD